MENKELKKSPFFAQLLEKQMETDVETNVEGGAEDNPWKTNTPGADDIYGYPTLKYPSDLDEVRTRI